MKTFTVRLKPGQDLRDELEALVKTHHIEAGIVLTCVGSLSRATLRLADENLTKVWDEKFEIVSLTGTLSPEGIHAHISLSDKTADDRRSSEAGLHDPYDRGDRGGNARRQIRTEVRRRNRF
jgi:predicted DNA-binding protein with PD1-like motif